MSTIGVLEYYNPKKNQAKNDLEDFKNVQQYQK